ncbi:MarR family winged helix-turn-helix transcriptional regulator [Anaerosporobacter faecicola]|uniref:MarR family winged helix-turn-helix transcriptional regulator n=1 Tax=Anaerosporobacter faecicola TaxID=2718714 RepID=UPI00143916FC|nr:MarR family transcriptional regulator [Anaerosporobacter faecicola]
MQSIGFEIKSVSNLIMRNIDNKLAKIHDRGYTKIQSWIIGYVNDESKKRDIFQKDIEKEFKIRRSTATGILQLMEKNGYLKRYPVAHDARLKKLVLTQKAIDLNEEIHSNIMEFEKELSDCLTKEELETFFKITEKLKKKLENN